MGNPFADLQNALTAVGIDHAIAGIILGAIFTVSLAIILEFVLNPKDSDKSGMIHIISFGLGIAFSTGFGWFNDALYIPILFGFVVAYVAIDPFDSRKKV